MTCPERARLKAAPSQSQKDAGVSTWGAANSRMTKVTTFNPIGPRLP